MADTARRITPVDISAEAWAPFGWLPVTDTDPKDGEQVLEFRLAGRPCQSHRTPT